MPTELQFVVDGIPVRLYAQEPDPASPATHAAIVLLHGAGGNLDFWVTRFGPLLHEAGMALYAPHYFDRTGTARADLNTIRDGVHTPQWIATIDSALRFVASRPGVNPEAIVLAGISLGAFLALAFAAQLSASKDPAEGKRIRALVEVSGGLVEPYARQATGAFPPTLILHGADDTIVPATHATRLDEQLTTLGVAHRTEILTNQTHWFTRSALPRLLLAVSGFLEEHLEPRTTTHYAM